MTVFFFLTALFAFFVLLTEFCQPRSASTPGAIAGANEYTGDISCKSCHLPEYDAWQTSDHFKAMLPAADSTVLGDFNNKSYTADGVRSVFFKKDGRFYINTEGPDGVMHDYQVLYTFGHYPLQQYLVAFPGGKMQATRASWDSRQQKWFYQYAGQKIHSSDWLHWTKGAQNWNTMCASCHSTNLQKNYVPDADSFHTSWSVINVSCESCHGAGKHHISYVNSDTYRNGTKVPGSYVLLPKGSPQASLLNSCAPCHAVKNDISNQLIASGELLDNYIPETPAAERFYTDGQVKDEAYTHTSFLQSKMFRHGVSCINCHNPHSGRLVLTANQLCLQCHDKKYNEPSHHFHAVNTVAAECKSCHMPAGTFMGNDIRHDHSFRVPRPDLSVQYGMPNACNACHSNKPAQWSADAVRKWYGPQRKYHFAEDLIAGSRTDAQAASHLMKLVADTSVPPMVKTAALVYLGSIFTTESASVLKQALRAGDAQMRYQALRSLSNFPPDQWRDAALPLLTDKVRAVRIAAADLLLTVPEIPETHRGSFDAARVELDQYLRYQADFPVGNVMLGDHYLRLKDYASASRFYLRGLAMDSQMNYARLNLSAAYNLSGDNDKALQALRAAAAIDPKNERIFYNLGLLYNEMQNGPEAIRNFEKAYLLKSNNPRLYYNYGLLLFQSGLTVKAEQVLLKGLALDPSEPDLNYALAFYYVKTGQKEKAKKYAAILKNSDPGNPDYQGIFEAVL